MFTSVGHDLVSFASLVTVLATCRSFESYDVDEVDTYTRILLHPRNESQPVQFDGDKLRANGEGPIIIDYPFPIHQVPPNPSSGTEYPVRLHNHHGYNQHGHKLGHLSESDTHASLVSTGHHFGGFGSAHLPNFFYPSKKKKKKFHKHKALKHLIPILVTLALKIAHLLPTLKLMLLALFSLLLFSKKAFLVSIGTLLIVLYQHMTSKYHGGGLTLGTIGLWKDRDQTAHRNNNYDGGPLPEGEVANDWWHTDGSNVSKIMPREEEKWKRWWKPQIRASHVPESFRPPQLEEHASLKDRIKENFDKFFGVGNSHHR